nr:nucleotide-binding alpha-beta plait domain-containing protein [Tanacetum cinerariifolium]
MARRVSDYRIRRIADRGNEEDGPDSRARGDRFYHNRRSADRGNEKVDRDPGNIFEIKGLWRRVRDLEIQHEIMQIRKKIRELELQREMRKETESIYVYARISLSHVALGLERAMRVDCSGRLKASTTLFSFPGLYCISKSTAPMATPDASVVTSNGSEKLGSARVMRCDIAAFRAVKADAANWFQVKAACLSISVKGDAIWA